MNNIYQKIMGIVFIGFISIFFALGFVGCGTDGNLGGDNNNPKSGTNSGNNSGTNNGTNTGTNTNNGTNNNNYSKSCLPGQDPVTEKCK